VAGDQRHDRRDVVSGPYGGLDVGEELAEGGRLGAAAVLLKPVGVDEPRGVVSRGGLDGPLEGCLVGLDLAGHAVTTVGDSPSAGASQVG
jgi:hypothetical protein